ncbi:universal stress protein UspA [Rhodospirillum rubrum]|uniref:universal stress protein n=1 Tax=Rhodospirillum rubrum TaxID=1085 RepID=UPI001905647D|nr:universal stress protein [Rhodospirillum rubrum]MBK1664158.1 universal stress protein UspA [Rhodospirillum rubrum]MBK1675821.1 universal stress protein UspA [Rhodospirillum rubrum]
MSKVLACTDGSIYGASVYDHAVWAATRLSTGVEVLHVLDQYRERAVTFDGSGAIGPDSRDDLLVRLSDLDEVNGRLAQQRSRAILDEAHRHILAAGLADVKLTQRQGSLVDCLGEIESQASLVVIGKRGENAAIAMEHLGANLERVIRASQRPVLVASRAFKPIERIVVAFDGGSSTRKAVDYLSQSPLVRGLPCHLLSVTKTLGEMDRSLAQAQGVLERGGVEASAESVIGEPEEMICKAVENGAGALLVMGAYGHSRIRRFIVGSTTTTMVRICHSPVLMFR